MAAFTISHGKGGGVGQIALPKAHWEALTPETLQAFRRVAGLDFVNQFYLEAGSEGIVSTSGDGV